jgi:hypothetical protein
MESINNNNNLKKMSDIILPSFKKKGDLEPEINEQAKQPINPERRKFLKLLLVGGGAFLLGLSTRFLRPISKACSKVYSNPESESTDFENFKVTEKKNQLIFNDKTGQEILILDRDSIDEKN